MSIEYYPSLSLLRHKSPFSYQLQRNNLFEYFIIMVNQEEHDFDKITIVIVITLHFFFTFKTFFANSFVNSTLEG